MDPTDCPKDLLYSEEEDLDLLLALDTTKSNGPDGISAKMLRGVACSWLQLLYLLSFSIYDSIYYKLLQILAFQLENISNCTGSQRVLP